MTIGITSHERWCEPRDQTFIAKFGSLHGTPWVMPGGREKHRNHIGMMMKNFHRKHLLLGAVSLFIFNIVKSTVLSLLTGARRQDTASESDRIEREYTMTTVTVTD